MAWPLVWGSPSLVGTTGGETWAGQEPRRAGRGNSAGRRVASQGGVLDGELET